MQVNQLLTCLESVAALFNGWGMNSTQWSLLDGPAIKLHHHDFDSSAWRDHFNVYVQEHDLPWQTSELEQTVPPSGSRELAEILAVSRQGIHLHLVPANRYYQAKFERKEVLLPSETIIEAATLRGSSQVWSYKSVEVIERIEDFGEDLKRIISERQARLSAALVAAHELDVRKRLILLQRGYQQMEEWKTADAIATFRQAAAVPSD